MSAQKRMFDRAILDTDRFMDLSMSAKALYFLLGMEADDEGFVSYKKVMRVHGGNEDDFRVLVGKGFLISFPSGVVVITDWNKNNYLDKNRIKETEYQNEKKLIFLTSKKEYVLNSGLTSIEESRVEENRIGESGSADAPQLSSLEEFLDSKKINKRPFRDSDGNEQDYYAEEGAKRPLSEAKLKELERQYKRSVGEVPPKKPKSEIDQVFDLFKSNPDRVRWFNNKTQHSAAEALLLEDSPEQLRINMDWYNHLKKNADKFFPEINSPDDLSKKYSRLMSLIHKAEKEKRTSEFMRL